MADLDLIVRDIRVVRPDHEDLEKADIGIADGRFVQVAASIDAESADEIDGRGRLAFPGLVDAHQHWGIYNPLEVDSASESRANVQGGVTTGITYIRTGRYYLNRGGPYAEFLPAAKELAAGNAYCDYAFHVAPMEQRHIDEIPSMVTDHGISSFKIFMFYGGHGLHGRSDDQSEFLMTPEEERYDLAHFEFVMRGVQAAREAHPDLADAISLSLHCETAEIMTAYTKMVEESGNPRDLDAYHRSRPPHSEGLAVTIASYLAHATDLPAINLLHLTSARAMEAALTMAAAFPHIDFRREVTIGHLVLDTEAKTGIAAKVNPPIRPREDVEVLWDAVLDGHVDWIVSDHACCRDEAKFGDDRDDVFLAKSGFGGAEYLLPALYTEGARRGLPLHRVAQLTSWNPAQRFGLDTKGTIAPGYDADLVLFDPDVTGMIDESRSESSQGYSPFHGVEVTGRVDDVLVRGQRVLQAGEVVGEPVGRFLHRPVRREG